MATGEVTDSGGSYLDRAFSLGGDALSVFIEDYRRDQDLSAQERIIRAQGEQDRITRATALPYNTTAQSVNVKTGTGAGLAALPMWAKATAGALVAGLGLFAVYKIAKRKK